MFIVWGEKNIERRLGRVADFCPICRSAQPFRAIKIARVGHLYYIPLGRGKAIGFVRVCETCGIKLSGHSHDYAEYSRDRHADLDTLIAKTQPQLYERWASRLDQEARARAGKLASQERAAVLREPFLLLNPWLETRGRAIESDRATGLGCLATLAVPALIYFVASEMRTPPDETLTRAALVVGGALAALTLYWMTTIRRRFTKRLLIPQLARALRPLDPSLEELEAMLDDLHTLRLGIGQCVKAQPLFEAIQMPAE